MTIYCDIQISLSPEWEHSEFSFWEVWSSLLPTLGHLLSYKEFACWSVKINVIELQR